MKLNIIVYMIMVLSILIGQVSIKHKDSEWVNIFMNISIFLLIGIVALYQ